MRLRNSLLFLLLSLLVFLSATAGATDYPTDSSYPVSSDFNGDLFFDFTSQRHDLHHNGTEFDESPINWQAHHGELTINNGYDCASDGSLLANGTLALTASGKKTATLSVQTGAHGWKYTGNADDIYAEVRVKATGFDGSKSGTLCIYPCNEDGSAYIQADGASICLTANYSAADLTSGEYVILRFTNSMEFARWKTLRTISHIAIDFRYDGIEQTHTLTYDYIYIGAVRQNHVMMDFTADSPANTSSHWEASATAGGCHRATTVSVRGGCLYGTTTPCLDNCENTLIATEDQLRYTVQSGDIVRIRAKFHCSSAKSGIPEYIHIGMGVGGKGYLHRYNGTILCIAGEDMQADGVYHDYAIRIPADSNMIGKPLRSFAIGFPNHGNGTVDFEIDYIYVGSEVNFTAYTGRSTSADVPEPTETDLMTVDNTPVSLRLFHYGLGVNDNILDGLPAGAVLESYFPFCDEYTNKDDYENRFHEGNGSTVMPYLSQDGYPMILLPQTHDNPNSVSLGCLFGQENAVGVHSYTPVNSFLTYDGETYRYDSTKHGVDYDPAKNQLYVRNTPEGGFTPFGCGKEMDNRFGYTMELDFIQTNEDAILELSCMDDAWVFIDGALVLDLGGSDVCKVGSVHFSKGEILEAAGGKSQNHTLLQRYQAAGRQAVTSWKGNTFAEGTVHTLKIFFLNRSARDAQCKLSFNLTLVRSAKNHAFMGTLRPMQMHRISNHSLWHPCYRKLHNTDTLSLWEAPRNRGLCLMEQIGKNSLCEQARLESLYRIWHTSPTGGDRLMIRTNDSTNAGLIRAISKRCVYLTTDQNFRLSYDMLVNGHTYQMGGIAKYSDNIPVFAIIELYDPDRESIGAVDLIDSNGKSVYNANITDSYASLEVPLTAEQTYYYVRVVGNDENHTFSAPIWLEKCNNHTPVTDPAVAPTCTEDGKTEGKHCSACYAVMVAQNTVPAIGHNYSYTNSEGTHTAHCEACKHTMEEAHSFTNGLCICGAIEVAEPTADETIHIRHALNLESSIALNYVVAANELRDYDTFYLECVIPEFEGNVQIGSTVVEIQPILKGNYYYFTLTGLSAVRMNDTVQATVHLTKDGVPYRSVEDVFSIADYAYGMLNNATVEDSLKVLCANLLRYGSEAQRFKSYRTNAPADAKMTDAHRKYLTNTATLQFKNADKLLGDAENPTIKWVGKTLALDSKIGIKFVFDANGYATEKLTIKLTYRDYAGTKKTIELSDPTVYNASAGYYAVTCYELSAAELRTVITAVICDGEKQLSESLQYSPESYASKTGGTTLEPLCRALFAYSDSAHAYFTR